MSEKIPLDLPSAAARKPAPAWKKWLKRLGFVLIGIVGSLLVFAVVLAVWPDSDPPDDSRLLPEWSNTSPAENPLGHFQEQLASASWIGQREHRLEILKEGEWDSQTADDLAEEYSDELDQWDRLASLVDKPWRWRAGEEVASYSSAVDGPSDYQALMTVAKLASVRAVRMAETDDSERALTKIEEIVGVGNKLLKSEGNLLCSLVAMNVIESGHDALELILERPEVTISPDAWKALIANLSRHRLEADDLRFAVQIEYLSLKALLDGTLSGDEETLQMLKIKGTGPAALFIQRNTTLSRYADFLAPVVNALETGPVEGARACNKSMEEMSQWRANLPRLLIHPNGTGNSLVSISNSAILRLTERLVERDLIHSLRLVKFAIERYRTEKGRLPERLDMLVPEYLPSVPAAPFTGESLIWDPEKGLVYSVGSDGVDHGGLVEQKGRWNDRDLGWRIEIEP